MFLDATYVKAHEGARVVSKAIVVATGVAADGNREVLGLAVGDSEDKAFWTSFLRSLRARGLAGVRLVISDAHEGLRASIDKVMLGARVATTPVHFSRNVLAKVPKGSAEMVAAAIRTIFAQPDAAPSLISSTRSPRSWAASSPPSRPCCATPPSTSARSHPSPKRTGARSGRTNPLERVNKEIKRRTNVVGIFPNEAGVLRLAGSVLLEVHDEWQVTDRRYLSEGSMAKLYEIDNDDDTTKEVGPRHNELLAG